MKSLAILHASQLVTLAGPKRPRVSAEMSELAIIRDGGMVIREGKIDIVGSSNGIWSTVGKTRAASDVDLLAQAKKHGEWFQRSGTTTVEAKSGYGLTVEDELKILRVMQRLNEETPLEVVPTFLGAHAVPRNLETDEYIALLVDEMLPQIARQNLAEFPAGPNLPLS